MKLGNIGLVLEGGGMRGTFTSGVLDYMLDNDIEFNYGIGVSAGACNGVSFVSHQRGRAKFSNIDLLDKYKYIGLNHLFRTGSIIDMDMLYNRFTEEILPFDYDSYFARPMRFEMVTTDCLGESMLSGRAHRPSSADRHCTSIGQSSLCMPHLPRGQSPHARWWHSRQHPYRTGHQPRVRTQHCSAHPQSGLSEKRKDVQTSRLHLSEISSSARSIETTQHCVQQTIGPCRTIRIRRAHHRHPSRETHCS